MDTESPMKKRKVGDTVEDTELQGNIADQEESNESDDGADVEGLRAGFNHPDGLCLDPRGDVFVADGGNHRIVCLRGSDAEFLCYAGGDSDGFEDGTTDAALFSSPTGVTFAPSGDLLIADTENNCIRKVRSGQVTTVAGCQAEGFRDGPASEAMFNYPTGVVCDQHGTIYIVDGGNHRIRKIANGIVSTFAGSGKKGYKDGAGPTAQFKHPGGMAVDRDGNVLVADYGNHRIRSISPAGDVKTLAGTGKKGHRDGAGLSATFSFPMGLAVNPATGDVVVADYGSEKIRLISPQGVVSTLAGTGKPGFKDGLLATATFNQPRGVACDEGGRVYVVDRGNHAVRVISDAQTKTIAGLGVPVSTLGDDEDPDDSDEDPPMGMIGCSLAPNTRDYLSKDDIKGM
jgi:DNA-binding beta-propeller fold protein YncE